MKWKSEKHNWLEDLYEKYGIDSANCELTNKEREMIDLIENIEFVYFEPEVILTEVKLITEHLSSVN